MMTRISVLFFIFLLFHQSVMASECQSYKEFNHKDAVILTAKYLGDKYDYGNNSRAYLAMTDPSLLDQVFGDKAQEAIVLKKAETDFREQVQVFDNQCFEAVTSLDIGNYDPINQTFSITEVTEQYSMIFEPRYSRNNRFPQKFKLFIANYADIKSIPYEKSQVEQLLNELSTRQARILHKLYFNVIGLKAENSNSLLVNVTQVDVIVEKQNREVIHSYLLGPKA